MRVFCTFGLLVAISLVACEETPPSAKESGRSLGVTLVEIRPGPSETTQVVLALTNEKASERSLVELRNDVLLEDRVGGTHRLHPISLGIKKPIVIPAKSTIQVPLLFEGKVEAVATLTFQDIEVSVPPAP